MDIHRCRFVPYQPAAINAVAFSHPKPRSSVHGSIARLAVGRSNGDIEIWNPASGAWHQELIIRGGKDRSIDSLVWVNDPDEDMGNGRVIVGKFRLFSIGYTSTITEWDLEKGRVKRHASGQHGDIWCMAAQPPAPTSTADSGIQPSTNIVAGTMHGDLAVYSVDDDDLRFQRLMVKSPSKKMQMISIAFQSRKVCVVGCSDSTIRVYDVTNGHMLRRMTLGSDLVGGAKNIIVWCVRCLPNGNIVSGDSTGQICIWNGKTYTQTQRIDGHKQDVLSLAISADGTSIVSGGMDRRTVLYKPNAGSSQRWSKAQTRRFHEHDVKAMAPFEYGNMSVVISGGQDASLMVIPLKAMGQENHRSMSCLPHQPPIASASQCRFMVGWWDRQVHIWLLRKTASDLLSSAEDALEVKQNRKLLKSIVIRGDSNITSASIDDKGSLLVVATGTDVKAFHLGHQDPVKPSDVTVTSLKLPQDMTYLGASQVKLSPDGEWLCLVQEGAVILMASLDRDRLDSTTLPVKYQRLSRLHRDIPHFITNGGLGKYQRHITQVAFSADSRMLAVADLAGFVDSWSLCRGGNDEHNADGVANDDASSSSSFDSGDEPLQAEGGWNRNVTTKQMPKLPSAPVVLSFSNHVPAHDDEADDYVLAAVTSSWHVLTFHPRLGALTPWSRRHPRSALPHQVRDIRDLPKGILWQGPRMWVYGVSFLLMIDLSQDLRVATDSSSTAQGRKRKRNGPSSGAGNLNEKYSLAPNKICKYQRNGRCEVVTVGEASREKESDSDADLSDADDGITDFEPEDAKGGDKGKAMDGEEVQTTDSRYDKTTGSKKVLATTSYAKGRQWWLTFKYRPVLGIVSLDQDDDSTLEVALVERPSWDREMPERYFASHELER
ncbi:hypothetical protein CDD80_832 [Ophiocordyceps camponoti-rufipedis]|uniref:Uncharacterized protein n=1 Tax=Ophiocordyceps camponoti-rufipedis TaxID=2004952 RepID=A0A2C5ZL59_9HYPO|nr:hypothetical protein CDD80_832 [Ophiocordyceps camponoti-rufipedis]